ncbi:PKD domain-containing protein [Maribacter flavus]|uniref:PKD domain-containing protein n=1 Tax=Maribacter flavus TaxID=1658664 RepID=A0A5B2TW87_9FLAO|nr:PKD domain-containing protein [Maribacter flavus]KAA2218662.1 PKD domain-containing protein [Maribacter flavus]
MKSFFKKGKLISMSALLLLFLGCSDDDEVLPEVVASFTQSIDQTTGTVTFTNNSQNATTYSWNFGNGNTSTAKNPTQVYENGDYTVTLTASNVAGDSDTATANFTITIPDDGGDGGDGGNDFDSGLLTNGDFEAGVEPWIGNAANVQEDGGNSFNFADVQAAGNPFDVNLSQVVAITQGTNYILKFDASSDRERTILAGIGLNEAPFTNTNVEINLTTATQTFELQLAATDFGGSNSRVLFDMGAAIGTVVIDNVSLVEGGDGSDSNTGGGDSGFDSGLLTNGDFEGGVTPWIGNAANVQEDGGNSFNFANVMAAGNVFDVNLSQVVAITQGTNYILTFDASSDRERTMLAGIGLNEAPFTNTSVSVNLTPETQTFTLQLAASDFGGANSRVLFDMGGEVGVVVIDNVSLVEGGDGSDSNPGNGGGTGEVTAFCNTQIQAFGGDAGSDIFLSVFNVNATTMRVEISSADSDPVDLLVLPAGAWVPNDAGISMAPMEVSPGVWAGEFFFPNGAPENVELFIEWSKLSFAGNWRSTAPDILDTVAFNATCDTGSGGGTGGGNTGDGSGIVVDFEDGGTLTGAFDNGANGANATNPDQSGINTSATVYQFNKIVGSAWYSGAFNVFPQDLSATGGTTFKMKIWSPNAGVNVRFQLEKEGNQGPIVTYNVDQTVTEANTWVELTFDFSSTPLDLTDGYDKIVIFPDYDESNQVPVATEAIYYFDDITQE